MALIDLANPTRFLAFARTAIPVAGVVAAAVLAVGSYLALVASPAEAQQGESVRILYIHVPAAWLGMACFVLMAASALGTLVWRHPLADVSQKAAAPIGAAFTALCLVTGALWGRPTWGAYWVWDARLTFTLIQLLIYLGILSIWHTIEDPGRAGRVAAVMTLVCVINIPIIKFSVDWWNTLHQGSSVLRLGAPTMDASILTPLLVMAAGATALFVALHLAAMRNEILRRRVRTLRILAAARGAVAA